MTRCMLDPGSLREFINYVLTGIENGSVEFGA